MKTFELIANNHSVIGRWINVYRGIDDRIYCSSFSFDSEQEARNRADMSDGEYICTVQLTAPVAQLERA